MNVVTPSGSWACRLRWVVHVIIGYRAESGVDGLRELAINRRTREILYHCQDLFRKTTTK